MFEDGFDLTQSDGLSRLDMQDPWFMEAIDVERGASSALYGNYALGGIVNFRTRRGRDIKGVETFTNVGSYGYQKYATAIGKEYKHMDAAVFVSHERGDGYQEHGKFLPPPSMPIFDSKLMINRDLSLKRPIMILTYRPLTGSPGHNFKLIRNRQAMERKRMIVLAVTIEPSSAHNMPTKLPLTPRSQSRACMIIKTSIKNSELS